MLVPRVLGGRNRGLGGPGPWGLLQRLSDGRGKAAFTELRGLWWRGELAPICKRRAWCRLRGPHEPGRFAAGRADHNLVSGGRGNGPFSVRSENTAIYSVTISVRYPWPDVWGS